MAGLAHHVREGVPTDVAYLAPTLIPVPGAFAQGGALSSYVGEGIVQRIQDSLVRADIGTNTLLC